MSEEGSESPKSAIDMDMEEDEHPQIYQHQPQQLALSPTDETSDGTMNDDRVEYAVLLPDSFAVLDSTFEQHSL